MKPRADAAEKALQAQTQLYQAAEAEFSKPTDSQAKIVDPKWHRNGGKRIEELMAKTGKHGPTQSRGCLQMLRATAAR